MFGTNKRITIYSVQRTITDSGSATEVETSVATNVPAAIQAHVLNNLPPPGDRAQPSGIYYLREFRVWIPLNSIPGLRPLNTWIIKDDKTGERYRVKAVVDDAGRAHHWTLRCENYQAQ